MPLYKTAEPLEYQPLKDGSSHPFNGVELFNKLKSELIGNDEEVIFAGYDYGGVESGLFVFEGKDLASRIKPAMGGPVTFYAVQRSEYEGG